MKSLKKLGVLGLAAALSLSVVACSKGGGGQATSTSTGTVELSMWTHNAGNKEELAAIKSVVSDFNASQTAYKVNLQAFPQDSYNQSVTAAAAAKKLPCILDIDQPNVANWAWAGYLAPIEGMDETLSKFLPSTVAKYDGKTYAYGYYDVTLAWVTRKSTLNKYDIRIPTIDQPWTADEFMAALKKLKDSGDFQYPADLATGWTGEWWPYAYSPLLQSFGGDLINRTDYKSAQGSLNGDAAIKWANWFAEMGKEGYIAKKSGSDPSQDFMNGKTALLWNGSWTAVPTRKKFGDDIVFAPPVDFGNGPKVGGGSWTWGASTNCADPAGAQAYLKFAAADKYVAEVAKDTNNIPATDAAAAMVPGFEEGGENDVFRQFAKRFTVMRPETPGYPFIATEFEKAAKDILNGADPKATLDQAVTNIDDNQQQFAG
ncbi:sugar ABC transporter substrate-binding protein [Micropruina sonneratiae]|uniref:sugar ABC transporter substrate-binding protein n=1 Tax=Micropruina sonneratiae TaxID=2986940 RepID=UPI002225CFEF|nr:sugar ABC transporter substrate-binding protein [Micropruina sp. KQZ13P-5]MCW3158888.1 sugar ABC transporter substrate-binding protein [Micropruina sp. KQZ13P-5]